MSIHDRLALELSRCQQEASMPEWMTKGKTTLISKEPPKRDHPEQLTNNMFIYDVENPDRRKEKKSIIRVNAADYFRKNRKDITGEQEELINYI